LANWDRAIELAREGKDMPPRRKDGVVTKAMTRRLPGWVELDEDGRPQLIQARAAVIRQILEWATAGFGYAVMVKKLIAGDVPAFGERVLKYDEDGAPYFEQADGERYGCGEWRTSYLRDILTDRRIIGELQPRDRHGNVKGRAIPDYYPSVATPDEFYAARAAIKSRKGKQGRIGAGVASLFSGLLKNARDGLAYYVAQSVEDGVMTRRLLNMSSIEGKSKAFTFDYVTFEREILRKLRELSPEEVLGTAPPPNATVIQGELDWIKERRAELAAVLLDGDLREITDQLRNLQKRETELKGNLETAREDAARPPADSWKDVKNLAELLDKVPEKDRADVRLRLRSLLRRHIDEILVLVVPRGTTRIAVVQIRFSGDGGRHRDYWIEFRKGWRNKAGNQPAQSACRSLTDADDLGPFDLRIRQDALDMAATLSQS
jgi:hypothetical protein